MKRLLTITCMLCAALQFVVAQRPISHFLDIQGTLTQDYKLIDQTVLKKGTPIVVQFITRLKRVNNGDTPYQAIIVANGKQLYMPLMDIEEHFQAGKLSKNQFWQLAQLPLAKHYTQDDNSKLKREQIQDAEKYIEEFEKSELFYNDEALEDYLQCLILEITPDKHAFQQLSMQQPLVRIVKSAEPDLMMLSNNTLLITTGLLTALDTEEELIALLSREVCHYLLDHSLIQLKRNFARMNRSMFWNHMGEIIAIAADNYLYERYDYYVPGMAFVAKDLVQGLINLNVDKQLGMDYSKSQEIEADNYALRFLENEGYNPQALCSALHKVKEKYLNDKGSGALTRYGKHSTLLDRLNEMGQPQPMPEDRKYLKTTMSVVSYEAVMHDYYKDYTNSQRLAMKNINHSLGTSDDYLMVARSIMKQSNTPASNAECQLYLDKSDILSETENVNITKMRILLLLRENKQVEATEQLKKYKQLLNIMYQQPSGFEDGEWIRDEFEWADQQLERIYTL